MLSELYLFHDVLEFVNTSLIEPGKTWFMEILTEIYGRDVKYAKDRNALKKNL